MALKGVILAGGSGTRLDPLTRITNKHLLPIYDRPMVAHAVQALVDAGLTSLLLVTGGAHVGDFARTLGSGHEYAIEPLTYACQDRAGGIAEALGLARSFVGDDRVLVMLADNLFERSLAPAIENFGQQERGARVVLSRVPEADHLRHLGVAELDGDRIVRVVEKPADPPSEYAVTGVYMYDDAGVGCAADARAVRARRARDHRREQLVRRARADGVRRRGRVLGRRGRVDRRVLRGQRLRAAAAGDAVIEDVRVIPLQRFEDERGWFVELRRESSLPKRTRQTNLSFSRAGTIRGLHYHERGQDDLFCCLSGTARVVALDRETGETFTLDIGDENPVAVYVPGLLAHGFEALTDVLFLYHVTEEYDPAEPDEHGVPWDDPRVVDLWSTRSPILSERDAAAAS